uniref:C2 domain-containing protein n=1 Tax=Plectus sambesii TaxID=2011161 RepID=A0A914WML0_9BILA
MGCVKSLPRPPRRPSFLSRCSETKSPQIQKQSCSHRLDTLVQTDLSLMRIGDKLNGYLNDLQQSKCHQQPDGSGSNDQGMNFLAKHFFEYQSFINVPDKGIRLHKTPASHAGVDQAAAWGPKSLAKTGKHLPAPQARSSRNNMETTHSYGRNGKHHDHREWGDRFGELKPEKVAHKDLWSKFLSGEDTTIRDVFNSEFEDKLLQTEPDTLVDVLKQSEAVDSDFVMGALSNKRSSVVTEILTILTYAPTVQFVTATIKKAKSLPFNHNPFARVLLFEGRRLVEQKQTTITTSVGNFTYRQNKDAIFSESFLFHMPLSRLGHCHVVIEIYDCQPSDGQPLPIGHVVLGPLCPGQGSLHWHQMIRKQGFPICMWHRLTH